MYKKYVCVSSPVSGDRVGQRQTHAKGNFKVPKPKLLKTEFAKRVEADNTAGVEYDNTDSHVDVVSGFFNSPRGRPSSAINRPGGRNIVLDRTHVVDGAGDVVAKSDDECVLVNLLTLVLPLEWEIEQNNHVVFEFEVSNPKLVDTELLESEEADLSGGNSDHGFG